MRLKEFVRSRVLPPINTVMKAFSLKLVPASTPNRDFSAFVAHLRSVGLEFKTVIDVGVAFGTPGLYDSLKGQGDVKFYLVEPVPECAPVLKNYERELGATTFNVAAGAEDGTISFNVHSDVSGSSSFEQWEGAEMDGKLVTVPVRRLDTLIPGPLARPSLLKVDTQGSELQVIEGAAGILADIDVIILECSFHQFRKNAPEFNEIVVRMNALGFACYETLEGHYRSVDNAMAQIDLVFVPQASALRNERGYFSSEQARKYLAAH